MQKLDNRFVGINPNFKNKIINGGFDVWQRGTSQTTSGYGSVDRWSNSSQGTSPIKITSRQNFTPGQTEVPGDPKYYIRTDVTTAGTEVSNYIAQWQAIEGVSTLSGKTATISFWAKAASPAYMSVEFEQNFGTGGSPSSTVFNIAAQKLTLTTAWQRFTITVSIPSISGKTIGTNGDDCLYLVLWFDAGSDYDSNTGSLGHQSGTFDIAQVQLEEGSVATEFERRPLSVEEMLCYRYYYTCTNTNGANFHGCIYQLDSNASIYTAILPVSMRDIPTVSYDLGGGSLIGTAAAINQILFLDNTNTGFYLTRISADAEL